MADQQETLKIKVDLDTGQATRNIVQFQQAAAQVGATVQNARNQAKPQIEEWQKAVANLSKEALGLGRVFGDLTKIFNPWVLAVGVVGYELYRQLNIMKEWSRNMTEMGNSARMAGLRLGEFRNISDQLRQAGVSAGQAQSLIQNFSRAYAELMQPGSERRAQLFAMAGPQFAGGMQQALITLSTFTTETQRLNYIRHQGLNVYANEFARTHDKQLATYKELIFLQAFGAEQLINRQTDFKELTEEQLKRQDKMNADAAELNAALEKERETREEIFNLTFGWTTKFATEITNIANLLETGVLDKLHNAPTAGAKAGVLLGTGINATNEILSGRAAVRAGEYIGGRLRGRPAIGTPERFIDPSTGRDAADPWGLAPGSLGYGNIAEEGGWRHSTNIEDDRNQEQVHAVDTNTKEFHDLNTRIERLLDTGVFGKPAVAMAKGGVVHGPTRALVGEAGPEAIVTRHGASVVNQPTHTVLGADGPAAVVPLRSNGGGGDAVNPKWYSSNPLFVPTARSVAPLRSIPGAEGLDFPMRRPDFWQGWRRSLNTVTSSPREYSSDEIKASRQAMLANAGSALARAGGSQDVDPLAERLQDLRDEAYSKTHFPEDRFPTQSAGGLNQGTIFDTINLRRAGQSFPEAKMAGGGIVVPMGTPPPGLGGPAPSQYGFSESDSLTPAGRQALAVATPYAQSALSSIQNVIQAHQASTQATGSTSEYFKAQGREALAVAGAGATVMDNLKSAAIHGVLEPMLTQAGMSSEGASFTSSVAGIFGTKSLADTLLPAIAAKGKQALQLGQAGLEYAKDKGYDIAGAVQDRFKDRLTLDRAFMMGGAVEGTVDITHQEQPASAKGTGRSPLFRPVQINRQSQMGNASGGPATTFSQDEMAPG